MLSLPAAPRLPRALRTARRCARGDARCVVLVRVKALFLIVRIRIRLVAGVAAAEKRRGAPRAVWETARPGHTPLRSDALLHAACDARVSEAQRGSASTAGATAQSRRLLFSAAVQPGARKQQLARCLGPRAAHQQATPLNQRRTPLPQRLPVGMGLDADGRAPQEAPHCPAEAQASVPPWAVMQHSQARRPVWVGASTTVATAIAEA